MSSLPSTWTRAARNAGRALVRSTPGFDGWLAGHPKVDRNALIKMDIIQAARDLAVYDLLVQVVLANANTIDSETEAQADNAAENLAIDARINAQLPPGEPPMGEPIWIGGSAGSGMGVAKTPAEMIEAVLEPIRQYLAPGLVANLADRLQPLAIAAAKPAVVREVVREVPAAPVAPPGSLPFAKIVSTATMSQVFGVRGAQAKLPVNLWDAADAPTPDPSYQVDPPVMAQVVTALEHAETVWLAGAAGTGKGALTIEYAARTRRPYVRIGFSRSTETTDLIGQLVPVPGETHGARMVWQDAVFTAAIRRPGTEIVLDELMISPPGTVAIFQTILDERRVTLPTGEVVSFAPGVVVVICDNSAGYGDETGAYAGVQPANAALVDRCGRLVIVDYLPPKIEAAALSQKTGLPFPAALRLAEFAKVVRVAAAKAGGEARPFSLRRLIAFAVATYRDKLTIEVACMATFLSRLPEADRATLRVAFEAHFKADAYLAEMNGETVDDAAVMAPPSQEAEQIEARRAFGS